MSTWEAVARQVVVCLDKDHKECDQTVCTPDNYPLHWMSSDDVALVLRLADHLNGSHTDGVKRPKTGPEAEEAPKPEPDRGDPGEGADKSADGEADQDSDGATVSPEDGSGDAGDGGDAAPEADSAAGSTLADAAKQAAQDLTDLGKAIQEAMGDFTPGKAVDNPSGDGFGKTDDYDRIMTKGEKPRYSTHVPTVQRVTERDPRSGRDRTLYEGTCTCGYTTSPHNFRSIGGANAAVQEHARRP